MRKKAIPRNIQPKKATARLPKKAETEQKTTAPELVLPSGIGRIPVTDISPVVENGAFPAKAVVGELIPIRAKIFREGHDAVNASVILIDPDGKETRQDMTPIAPTGLDWWETWVRLDSTGLWHFRIESWSDPWQTWHHNAVAKISAGIDFELVCLEGQDLLQKTAANAKAAQAEIEAAILEATKDLLLPERNPTDLLEVINSPALASSMRRFVTRELISPTPEYPIFTDRKKALFSSWYEFFPRSIGAHQDDKGNWISGTFKDCHKRLEEVAAMGFDVVYFPPIHPIGSAYKKGKNNSLEATEADPGSPWAIGAKSGGHDAIHPDLGTWKDFDDLIKKAESLGIEIALDLALQASPDHPWVSKHPEWFTTRLDGTIAYAENPPKKYQDIYPINFDNDPAGLYHEILRILKLWISHGVKIFRVDNPHTKPVIFWAWLMREIRKDHPEVLFLAEAFTKPAMMKTLGKVGFHQSYTYFTWRNEKWEIEEYLKELSQETDSIFRPNFFVNTPDINPFYLQSGKPAAFAIRAILAATLSPTWGVYAGFELFESEPLKIGGEEYLNSEKYEYRPRNYQQQPNLNLLIGKLNEIRKTHPALQQLRQISFHHAPHNDVLVYSKRDGADTLIMVVSLNQHHLVESEVYLNMADLGLPNDAILNLRDELTGQYYRWHERAFVRLTPEQPAHILTVLEGA